MNIDTILFPDRVNWYDGDDALLYANDPVKLVPLSNQEAMTESGGFDRTRFTAIIKPDRTIPTRSKLIVVTASSYPAGMTARMEGEAQAFAHPVWPAQAHHLEATMIKEQH